MNIINFHLKIFYVSNENESLRYVDLVHLSYNYLKFDAEIIKTILLDIIILHFNCSCYIFLIIFSFFFHHIIKLKKLLLPSI